MHLKCTCFIKREVQKNKLTFFENWDFGIAKQRFGLLIVIDYNIVIALKTNMASVISVFFFLKYFWLNLTQYFNLSSSTTWLSESEAEPQNVQGGMRAKTNEKQSSKEHFQRR